MTSGLVEIIQPNSIYQFNDTIFPRKPVIPESFIVGVTESGERGTRRD